MKLLKHFETSRNTQTLIIRCDNIGAIYGDVEARCGDIGARRGDRTELQQYRHGVFSDNADCSVGVTPQMCNRVTNHGDMGTFSKPGCSDIIDSQPL